MNNNIQEYFLTEREQYLLTSVWSPKTTVTEAEKMRLRRIKELKKELDGIDKLPADMQELYMALPTQAIRLLMETPSLLTLTALCLEPTELLKRVRAAEPRLRALLEDEYAPTNFRVGVPIWTRPVGAQSEKHKEGRRAIQKLLDFAAERGSNNQ